MTIRREPTGDRPLDTLRRLTGQLTDAGIPYAVCGSMAVSAHGQRRTTGDVDVLLTNEGLETFRRQLARHYEPTGQRRGRRFKDRANGVLVDVFVAGNCPGPRTPGAVEYPDPAQAAQVIDGVPYVGLVWLIRLKLTTGRYRDLGDVAALIRVHQLDETFLAQLPASLHKAFLECLEEMRREEEFEARED